MAVTSSNTRSCATGTEHAREQQADLGSHFSSIWDAEAQPGVQIIADPVGLDQELAGADWVFTGEGSVDAQTVLGKTPFGVAQIARHHNTPVIIFAGRVGADASILLDYGVNELVAITPTGTPTDQALRGPAALTRATAEVCRRILSLGA